MSIEQIIINPGIDVFFNRNGEKTPDRCPLCLSKNVKWSIIEENKLNSDKHGNAGYSVQFVGFKMNCYYCFAEIDFKER